jgi:sec-independent protein translocase protein tatA/E homolog
MGSFSIWHWLILAVIVVMIFGTTKLKNAGKDLGSALRDFKKSLHEDEDQSSFEDSKKQ